MVQSQKTGPRPDPTGVLPGAEQLGVDPERTPEPSSGPTGETGVSRASPLARLRRPKREGLWGPADLLPTGHSPTSNPADSATLRLQNTSIRNGVTRPGLSAGSLAEQGQPYRTPGAG